MGVPHLFVYDDDVYKRNSDLFIHFKSTQTTDFTTSTNTQPFYENENFSKVIIYIIII